MITSFWRLLLPLGLLGSFALAENPAPPPATPAPPEEREVWVPTDALKSILARYPRAVMLSREQYQTLLRDARLATPKAVPLPRPVALQAASYQARVTGSTVNVAAEFTVLLLGDGWTEVPLDFGGGLIGSVQVDGEAALEPPANAGRAEEANAAPLLLLRGQGERVIHLEFSVPLASRSGVNDVWIKLPTAAASVFHLTLPPNQRVESPHPIRLERTAEATLVTAAISPAQAALGLSWRGLGDTSQALVPLVEASGVYAIDAEKIHVEYDYGIETQLGNLPQNCQVSLPPGVQVLQVTGDEIARWTIADGHLEITLLPGERARANFRLVLELPSLGGAATVQASLPVPRLEGFPRMQGTYFILRDAGVVVKEVKSNGAVQPANLPVEAGANLVGSYRFFAPPKAISATIEKVQPGFSADLDTQVEFKPDAIFLERTLTIHPEEGEIFQTALTLPREEELLTVRTPDGVEPEWRREGGQVLLRWAGQASAPVFKIRTRLEPAKWTQPGPDGILFQLGDAPIDGVKKVTGYIALQAGDTFRLEAEPSETLERRDGRTTPVHGDYAWFRRGDFSLRVKVAKRPGEVQAILTGYALPLEGILDLHAQMDFQFLHAGARSVRLRVPAEFAQNFYFDGPQIAERNLEGDVWTITFQKELTGAYALKITAQIPVTKTGSRTPASGESPTAAESRFGINVPVITPLDVVRSSGVWAVEANTETEITFESKGMNEIDSLQAPRLADYQPRHRVIGVFSWLGADYSLALSGVRHAAAPVITSVVDQLDLDTVVSTSGAERSEARFALRTAGAQYLDVQLPPKSRLLSLGIDGEMVKPVGDRLDFVRVQLPARRNMSSALSIALLYETPQGEWRSSGGYAARAPKLASEIPILRSRWRLYLPDGFEYTGLKSNLSIPEPEIARPLVLSPLSIWDEWRVEHATAILASSGIADPRALDKELPPHVLAEARRRAGLSENLAKDFNTGSAVILSETKSVSGPPQIVSLFREAQGFYETGRFALAMKRAQQILALDPNNASAQQFKEKIDRAMADYGVSAFNETRSDMVRDADMAWARPIRRFNRTEAEVKTEEMQHRLERIIIPKLEFRETTLREAVDFLRKKSVVLSDDGPNQPPIRFVLQGGAEKGPLAPNAQGVMEYQEPRITVSLNNIPLIEALRYVTGLANVKFKIEPSGASITPATMNTDVFVTKEWQMPVRLFPGLKPNSPIDREVVKKMLEANGVTFNGSASAIFIVPAGRQKMAIGPAGASATASLPAWGRLIVRNTQDQLDLIDTITLSGGTTAPNSTGEDFAAKDQRVSGLVPIKLDLPKVGRLVVLEGLAAAEHAEFHYDDWWARARRLWLWFVAGGFGCLFFAGRAPWWRTGWVILLLTFFPLIVNLDAMPVCNALLGCWLLALALMRVAARLVFVPQRTEVLA